MTLTCSLPADVRRPTRRTTMPPAPTSRWITPVRVSPPDALTKQGPQPFGARLLFVQSDSGVGCRRRTKRPRCRGVIRIRRIEPRLLRRRRYEVECTADETGDVTWSRVTSTPVRLIERDLGVGDAWSLINAADDAWREGHRDWITLYGRMSAE